MKRAGAALFIAMLLPAGCATEGTSATVGLYGGYYYEDWWYAGAGCCTDYPGDIGPPAPRPEHPIALPPGSTPRPEQPIAGAPKAQPRPSTTSSMPSPRPAASMRGGGGGRGGGGRR